MTCPFKHLWASEVSDDLASRQHKVSPPSDPSTHPETTLINSKQTNKQEPACPLGHTAPAKDTLETNTDQDAHATQPTCPLGFGSSKGAKLTSLHCIICKSFFFSCVKTECGHTYCAECIAPFRDCPTCGSDISPETNVPSPEDQDIVESFLNAHAKNAISILMGLDENQAPPSVDGDLGDSASKAAFILQVGLRSLAGNNISAATHRFMQCLEELDTEVQNLGENTTAERQTLSSQKGAILGLLGDCARRENRLDAAMEYYMSSAEILRQITNETVMDYDAPCTQALAVTLNKMGEVRHVEGDLMSALDFYTQALNLRREVFEEKCGDDEKVLGEEESFQKLQSIIEVIFSQIKVATCAHSIFMMHNNKDDGGDLEGQKSGESNLINRAEHLMQGAKELLDRFGAELQGHPQFRRKVELAETYLDFSV